MLTPTTRPPMQCVPEGQIVVDFGRHRLTADGRVELESLAHAYLGRWLGLVAEGHEAPPPGYPASAQFSLTETRLDLPVRRADALDVMRALDALFDRPGILVPRRRKP